MNSGLAARDAVLLRWGPWQDAVGLLRQVPEVAGGTVVVLGDERGGGLAALQSGARVVRVDPATPAGASLVLSVVACRLLPQQSAAALFGEDAFGRRIWFYHHVRDALFAETRAFWDERERFIRLGLCTGGAFETRLARLRPLFRLGPGARRSRLQARAIVRSWGHGAALEPSRWSVEGPWWDCLRAGRPPALTATQHAEVRANGSLEAGVGPGDVVWLGDALDHTVPPDWTTVADVAVGWSVRATLPAPPPGWRLETVSVPDDNPLVRGHFVMRRERRHEGRVGDQ